jgi:hypothetical protein
MKDYFARFPNALGLLTVSFGGLPFVLYFLERTVGSLPTSEVWYAAGTNHGPWRHSPEALTIYYPVLVLLIATLIMSLTRGTKDKKISIFGLGGLLLVGQIALLVAQMLLLTWLID